MTIPAWFEKQHSDLVNELEKIRNLLNKSVLIDFEIAKWKYELANKNLEKAINEYDEIKYQTEKDIWRRFMIKSCPKHEYRDKFSFNNEYNGYICIHCTANSEEDEDYETSLKLERSCSTCEYSQNIDGTLYCGHPITEDLDEKEVDYWMDRQMEDAKNCEHWKGKF